MSEDKQIADIKAWLAERRITDVECVVPDVAGTARGKSMNASLFIDGLINGSLRLPEIIYTISAHGDTVFNERVSSTEKDLRLDPDMSTFVEVPWSLEKAASVICDGINDKDDTPSNLAPRQILKHVVSLFEAKGWTPIVGPEAEFYLLDMTATKTTVPTPPEGSSETREHGQYIYSLDAVEEFSALFKELYEFSEIQNIDLQTLIHEDGPCQFEINIGHGEALSVADQLFLFKRLARQTAKRHDLFISFMAKPYADDSGSSIHLHQSVIDKKTGKNLFADKDGEDTELFGHYVGGLQKYISEAMLMFAPYSNSYQRFKAYMSAPTNTHWSRENRTVGLRVPESSPSGRRIENRIPGADINPYLGIAASLLCGYAGMVEKVERREEFTGEAYQETDYTLPKNITAGIRNFQKSKMLRKYLGDDFVETFAEIKETENEDRSSMLNPWDKRFLLTNV